jgi:hypothetical protein
MPRIARNDAAAQRACAATANGRPKRDEMTFKRISKFPMTCANGHSTLANNGR